MLGIDPIEVAKPVATKLYGTALACSRRSGERRVSQRTGRSGKGVPQQDGWLHEVLRSCSASCRTKNVTRKATPEKSSAKRWHPYAGSAANADRVLCDLCRRDSEGQGVPPFHAQGTCPTNVRDRCGSHGTVHLQVRERPFTNPSACRPRSGAGTAAVVGRAL